MEKKSILIVEDEKIPAIDLRDTLISLGYRITGIAPSGERAIEMADEETPDLILMDIRLSGKLSGIEAAEQILKRHSIPIIYLTAYADPELVEQAKQTRPYGYLIKPCDERGIRTEIEIALHKADLDRKLEREYANLEQRVYERTNELSRINAALQKSERRYRLLFERSGEGIFIFEAGGEDRGRIVEVNAAGAAMHGYLPEELLRMKITDLDVAENLVTAPYRFEAILHGEWIGGEVNHVRKDGSVFPIDFQAGLLELDGHNYVFSVIRDISEKKKIEIALQESESFNRGLVENIPDYIVIYGLDGMILFINPASTTVLGYNADKLVGTHVLSYIAEEDRDTVTAKMAARREGGDTSPYEIDIVTKNGLRRSVIVKATPIQYQNNPAILLLLIDITGRKKAEEALRESEAKFREIFNSANDAIHLHEIDERGLPGKFIDVNDAACRMLQYSKEELLEKSALNLTTDYHSRPPEQIEEEIKTKGSALFETGHRRKDGVIVPVEVNAHIVVIQDRRMMLSIIRNLTRRKRDEAAFRQLSADHKAIIDHAPAMIWYKDTKNTFIRVNPAAAQAFGMAIEEIEGKSTYDLFSDLAEKYYQDDLEVINSGKPRLGIIGPMTLASGEHLWVQTDKIPLRDEQGTITGILLFVADITERKRTEEALALASRKINLLSNITRHDILNQLMALKAYIELSRHELDKQMLAKYISTEEKIAGTLERQINFTREYQDLGMTAPVWQNIHAGIEKAVAALPMRKVTVKRDFADSEVFADLLFEKVFYNLIDNALRYGGDKMTSISVSLRKEDDSLVIVFEDNGVGISADDKPNLFTRGFGKNTGLGLFLSREILSITGIMITETGVPGKGARFEITVPEGAWRTAGNGA